MRSRFIVLPLLAVIVVVLGGFVLADRTLADEDRMHATSDVLRTAGDLRDFVRVHLAALGVFHGALADGPDAVDRERFLVSVRALAAGGIPARGFRRVWVADSAGVVLQDYLFGAEAAGMPPGTDLDTVRRFDFAAVMATVRRTQRAQVSRADTLFSGERGIVLVRPVVSGERLVGFAGGSVEGGAILAAMPEARVVTRLYTRLGAATGAIATSGAADGGTAPIEMREQVEVPGAEPWVLVMGYDAPSFWVRVGTWALGLTMLAALTLALLHERRQALRIADRSSELERLSGELLAANRAKSEFLANISHELRTPLNAIVGFADLLRDGVYGELGPRQVGPVQRIEVSATHLRQLVDQILDLAKITAGRLEVHVEPIDLRPFVLDVASEVESLINEKGLQLSIAVGATLPRARTDPSHLRQILVNLIGNAVKYTEQGSVAIRARRLGPGERLPSRDGTGMAPPPAVVATRPEGAWIALQVIDTGVGIPADDRERIFEEFEQVNAGPRGDSARRGTGLGLPISRRLARLLGGDVTVDAELGRGSTFTLWLPVEG